MTCCATITRVAVLVACMASLSGSALAQPRSAPSGHPDYRPVSIEAVDNQATEGRRASTWLLKMVRMGARSASLKAKMLGSIKLSNQEPTWSGFGNASSFNGVESAQWQDSDTGSATVSTSLGSASVNVEIVDPEYTRFAFGAETVGKTEFKKAIDKLFQIVNKDSQYVFSLKSEIVQQKVDFYNRGDKTGYYQKVDLEAEIGFQSFSASMPFPTPVPGVTLFVELSAQALRGSLTFSAEKDASKENPWIKPVTGSIGGGVTISGRFGVQAGAPHILEARASGNAETTAGITGSVSFQDPAVNISGQFDVGTCRFSGSVSVLFAGGEWTAYETEPYEGLGITVPIPSKEIFRFKSSEG